jgi:DNA topoisomerase-1
MNADLPAGLRWSNDRTPGITRRRHNGCFAYYKPDGTRVTDERELRRFRFRGKSGKEHTIALDDARLARILRRCRDLPGEELFKYVDPDRGVAKVDSDDVNAYLREIAGDAFSAKDFRTWIGTVACASALREAAGDAHEAKANVVAALECVAAKLGNTPAVCRKSYVHPAVIEVYLRDLRMPAGRAPGIRGTALGLSREELFVRRFLERAERSAAA